MARRKRFAEAWEIPPQEAAPQPAVAREAEEDTEEQQNEPGGDERQKTVMQLQRAAGNTAATRALNRFRLPELAAPGAPEPQLGKPDLGEKPAAVQLRETLEGRAPKEQIELFRGIGEHLTGPMREIVTQASVAANLAANQGPALARIVRERAVTALAVADQTKFDLGKAKALVDKFTNGVSAAWAHWHRLAIVQDISIFGPTASGGQLKGPEVADLLRAYAAPTDANEADAASSLGRALDGAFKEWAARFKLPHLPIFPAFAAFPGPVAPPTPAIPFPLLAIPDLIDVTPFKRIKHTIQSADPTVKAATSAVADALGDMSTMWVLSTTVIGVLGTGHVPTFAPPYVPVGPVVAGSNLPLPGVLSGGLLA